MALLSDCRATGRVREGSRCALLGDPPCAGRPQRGPVMPEIEGSAESLFRQVVRMVRTLLMLVVLAAAGCTGSRVALTPATESDAAVRWIFRPGVECGLDWWLYPSPTAEWVSVGALVDSQVVLMCNLNGATERLMPCRLYVLEARDGRVTGVVRGPTQAFWHEDTPLIDNEYAYVHHPKARGPVAFDIRRRTFCWSAPPPPDTSSTEPPPLGLYGYSRWECDPASHSYCHEYRLPSKRKFREWGRPLRLVQFELDYADASGAVRSRKLCRLPDPGGGTPCILIADTEENLIIACGSYVICIDPQVLKRE